MFSFFYKNINRDIEIKNRLAVTRGEMGEE